MYFGLVKDKITTWIEENNFSHVAVFFDLDVLSTKEFRSIMPVEPYLRNFCIMSVFQTNINLGNGHIVNGMIQVKLREYRKEDVEQLLNIWNQVVKMGNSFPDVVGMSLEQFEKFLESRSFVGVAIDEKSETIAGFYTIQPNNVGLIGHIANGTYAVKEEYQGQGLGTKLLENSLTKAKNLGFEIMQFNAVFENNTAALHLYKKLGFQKVGRVPNGVKRGNKNYEDFIILYRPL